MRLKVRPRLRMGSGWIRLRLRVRLGLGLEMARHIELFVSKGEWRIGTTHSRHRSLR